MTKKTRQIDGLYAVTPDQPDTGLLVTQVTQALEGGARLVQYRNKVADANRQYSQARKLLTLCRAFDACLIINDSVELALAVDADGAHVGASDGSIAEARSRLSAHKILGVSCYDQLSQAQVAANNGADYVAFGAFFPSPTKPAATVASLDLLRSANQSLSIPVVAIGGITLANAPALVANGADAVAVISALFSADDIAATATAFSRLFTVTQDHHDKS